MGNDFRIDGNWIRPAIAAPPPPPRVAPPLPDDQEALRSLHRPDLLRLTAPARQGLNDPLPSLSRISAILSPSAPRAPKGTGILGIPEDREFVQKAFKEAFGRWPSKPEFSKALDSFTELGDRRAFLLSLIQLPAFQQAAMRVDHALQVGTPVSVPVQGRPQSVLWPYPRNSRNGGPDQLSTTGDMNNFRDYMGTFANYFGGGTRGSQMLWVESQGARGAIYPGSDATRQLGAIAQNLFWDLPTLQNSDAQVRQAGVGADLANPATMISYLQAQKQSIETLIKRQDWTHDGSVHRQSARELLAMVDGAMARAQAFFDGDRTPMAAREVGAFGVYDTARPLDRQTPLASGQQAEADPKSALSAAEAKLWQNPDQGERAGFYGRLASFLLGD